ncbi:hypothetical protein J2786_004597 [Chryseobacterium vietnamense]|uniref:Uncharacterized protein n=1 Tax=Chryseobacterium vietnamense TaxID=866785 RepID=A0ACC6JEV5_9FLAO|nr:hypothetical protein [Chryseobacterium vietnamense]
MLVIAAFKALYNLEQDMVRSSYLPSFLNPDYFF